MSLNKEALLNSKLRWRTGATDVRSALRSLIADVGMVLSDAGVLDELCKEGEWDTRYTAGISRAVAENIRFQPLQSIAKTALINNQDYTADPGLFFQWLNKITKERWPNTPVARERAKGIRSFAPNNAPNPTAHKPIPSNQGGDPQRDARAQNRFLQTPSHTPKPFSYKQSDPKTGKEFIGEMRSWRQVKPPQSTGRGKERTKTAPKKDVRPQKLNDKLKKRINTMEGTETSTVDKNEPAHAGGDETPPELAGQLSWNLLEPDEVKICLTGVPKTKNFPISCTIAYDSMAGVNVATEGIVQLMNENWPWERHEEQLTNPLSVELGDSSIVALDRVTMPLSITQTTAWGTLSSHGVRAVIVAGENATFTAGRPLLDEWRIGPKDALKQRAEVQTALERSFGYQVRKSLQEGSPEALPMKRIALLNPEEHAVAVLELIDERVKAAHAAGLPGTLTRNLLDILIEYRDVFRVSLQADPPLAVPPLHINLKEGAVPKRMKPRPLMPAERLWLWRYLDELESIGYVERIMTSEWASNGSAPAKPVEPGVEQPDLPWEKVNRRLVANYVYVNSQCIES